MRTSFRALIALSKSVPRPAGFAAAALLAALIAGASPALAETMIFKDALKPHGVSRSNAEKHAAFAACKAMGISDDNVPAVEKCLRGKGWVLASIKPDPSDLPGATYDDMWQPPNGPRRSSAVLDADTRACDPSGNMNVKSAASQHCMSAHGWRLSFVIPTPSNGSASVASDPYGNNDVWTSTRGSGRSDDVNRADADACIARTGPNPVGQPTSAAMKSCMLARGWRYDHTDDAGTVSSSRYYDPEQGLWCHDEGIAQICTNF
jgi:hypothetical protein